MNKEDKKKKILTMKEWRNLVKQTKDNRIYKAEKKREWKKFIHIFRLLIPIPLIIGIIAAIITWNLYGANELLKILLSWIIGITLVTTVVATLLGKVQNIFRK
jgi:MFS superfamily sulfate permease-like transporter